MANIFQNIGRTIGNPIGNLVQGVHKGLAPGVYEQEGRRRHLEDLQKKLMMLQQMPQGTDAYAKYARHIMETHGPEIMKNLQAGAYQRQEDEYGTSPWYTNPAMRERFPKETAIAGGTEPRAIDPWIKLGRMADAEANLGMDPFAEDKPRFPAMTKEINRQISGFTLPGAKPRKRPIGNQFDSSTLFPSTFYQEGEYPSFGSRRKAVPSAPVADKEYGIPQSKTAPPAPVDYDRIEKMLGRENAQMEQKAWGIIYDAWDSFPRKLQDAIRAKEKEGISFTEILQYDEVKEALQKYLK